MGIVGLVTHGCGMPHWHASCHIGMSLRHVTYVSAMLHLHKSWHMWMRHDTCRQRWWIVMGMQGGTCGISTHMAYLAYQHTWHIWYINTGGTFGIWSSAVDVKESRCISTSPVTYRHTSPSPVTYLQRIVMYKSCDISKSHVKHLIESRHAICT